MIRKLSCSLYLAALGVFGCAAGETPEEAAATDEAALGIARCGTGFCKANAYCQAPIGTCSTTAAGATCAPRPQVCPQIYAPVCGCDGHTYSNSCSAAAAGVSVASSGACPSQFCGGIAGIPCPGGGQCVDDPSDSCDPKNGGADCGGICACRQTALCIRGSHFDSSPAVCACVPNDPCATIRCAAGTHCVANGGRATCVADVVHCGGIAGIACPGAGRCVDDPSDNCDPANGGADCGGICNCIQTVLCTTNSHFDSSPAVCACVPN